MRTSRRMLKQVRRALCAALAFSGCINLLMLATPLYTLQVFQTVVPLGSLETLAVLTLITAAAIVTLAILEGVRDNILLRAGLWLDHHLGEHILSDGIKRGAPANELMQDAQALERVRAFLTNGGMTPLFDAPWVPIFMCALVLMHPMIGSIAAVAALLLMAVAFLQSRLTSRLSRETGLAFERSQRWWMGVAGNSNLAGALGLADGASRQWELTNRRHIAGMYSLGKRTSAIKVVSRAIRVGAQIALYGIGAWLIVDNQLSPGVLVASAILLARALAPFEHLNGSWKSAQAAYAGYLRLRALPPDAVYPSVSAGAPAPHGLISLSDVTYYHPNRKTPAMRGIHLTIQPGECLGIVGPNGSGKSTLVSVIAGAAIPTSGSADLDGLAISKWQRSGANPPIGYMPDEPLLIEGTIHDNIARFQEVTSLSVVHAAQLIGVHDILAGLPSGYDTMVGPGGSGLALRERRAVALARAVYGSPHALILDEPEIGLDGASFRRLLTALQALKDDGTSLIIATQDPRLLALADQVAVLNGGTIQAAGTGFEMAARMTPARVGPVPQTASSAGAH